MSPHLALASLGPQEYRKLLKLIVHIEVKAGGPRGLIQVE